MNSKRAQQILDSEWEAQPQKGRSFLYNIIAMHLDLGEDYYRDVDLLVIGGCEKEYAEHIVEVHNLWRNELADNKEDEDMPHGH